MDGSARAAARRALRRRRRARRRGARVAAHSRLRLAQGHGGEAHRAVGGALAQGSLGHAQVETAREGSMSSWQSGTSVRHSADSQQARARSPWGRGAPRRHRRAAWSDTKHTFLGQARCTLHLYMDLENGGGGAAAITVEASTDRRLKLFHLAQDSAIRRSSSCSWVPLFSPSAL